MTDERYVFIQDVKEKKGIARSAAHKKNGCKSTRCTLPSDYLTKKEREKMNGEVKSWNMNKFYSWEEFKNMPVDIQEAYISTLVQKYKVGLATIANKVFGITPSYVYKVIVDAGFDKRIAFPRKTKKADEERFVADINAMREGEKPKTTIYIPDGMAPGYDQNGNREDSKKNSKENAPAKIEYMTFSCDRLDYDLLRRIEAMFEGRKIQIAISITDVE